ncbi:MAG TPA: hypothetical protein VFV72_07080 [Candidatus Limnocylindrales bacterium]|nr:hypothetical protein [Candidatus Limnocylindrales bacterium]
MNRLSRHARGVLVAIAALVLTAGAAVAARPTTAPAPPAAASGGLDRAVEAAGKTVPVAVPVDLPEQPTVDEDADDPVEHGDAPEANAGEHPDNHGAAVSAAAQGPTPDSATNHGQFVRSVATANHGQDVAADARAAAAEKGAKPNR